MAGRFAGVAVGLEDSSGAVKWSTAVTQSAHPGTKTLAGTGPATPLCWHAVLQEAPLGLASLGLLWFSRAERRRPRRQTFLCGPRPGGQPAEHSQLRAQSTAAGCAARALDSQTELCATRVTRVLGREWLPVLAWLRGIPGWGWCLGAPTVALLETIESATLLLRKAGQRWAWLGSGPQSNAPVRQPALQPTISAATQSRVEDMRPLDGHCWRRFAMCSSISPASQPSRRLLAEWVE